MGDNTTFTRAYCNRVSFHLWLVVVVMVVVVVVVVVVCSESMALRQETVTINLVNSREKLRDGQKMTYVTTHVIQLC